MPEYRSVSQLKEYDPDYGGCPHRYYLHRVLKAWERPAAWLPQGLAVHEAAEQRELSRRTMPLAEMQRVYTESYDLHTNRLCEDTPNFKWWFRSGPYDGRTDVERRYGIGLEQVQKYIDYYDKFPDDVPMDLPDGSVAVEYPFTVEFGTVAVRGVIDYIRSDGKPKDNKSGNKPGDPVQLATYAGVIEQQFGIKPTTGTFWMGKTGKDTVPLDLSDWTQQRLADVFGELDESIRAELFEPAPEASKCMFCSVAAACSFSL